MKRLLGWCTTLIAVFGTMSAAAMLSTHGQVNPFASMFTMPDGQVCGAPCLFGVVPGVTTFDEAIQLLQQHPLTSQFTWIDAANPSFVTAVGNGIVINLRSSSSGLIREALIFFVDDTDSLTGSVPKTSLSTLTLGDVQVYFHMPTRVSIATTPLHTNDSPRNFSSWYYDAARLLVTGRVLDAHMYATTPLKHIQLSADRGNLGEFSPVNYVGRVMVSYTTQRWFGFTALSTYMQAAIQEMGVRQLLY